MFHPNDTLIDDIAAVALGDDALRSQVETRLARLEKQGWHVTPAVLRIWAGERDLEALTRNLDADDLRLVQAVLAQLDDLETCPPEEYAETDSNLISLDKIQVRDDLAQRWERLPEALRFAVLNHDIALLMNGLSQMTSEQAQETLDLLLDTGLLEGSSAGELLHLLDEFAPTLQAIVAVARGDPKPRPAIEDFLNSLEWQGWRLYEAVQRLWAGERDIYVLSQGLGERETILLQYVLEQLE